MTPNREFGRATPAPVNILPELKFDLCLGQPPPAALGKTEAPVNILPELAFDLGAAGPAPALQLSLQLRPGTSPGEVALDLFRLYTAVNQLELNHHGAGLVPDDALCNVAPTGGEMRVTFKPTDPNGAVERLTALVNMINGAVKSVPEVRLQYRSIERCEAKVVPVAA